ncbi:Uncharacterised protein [Vibrio cholerae]|nr:Uncharacterised protein [Vibrio cholerae]
MSQQHRGRLTGVAIFISKASEKLRHGVGVKSGFG